MTPEENGKSSFRARPIFRIFAVILALPAICLGSLALLDQIGASNGHSFSTKFGIAAVALGVLFLVVGIRRRLFK
jgi:hypothetical protein